MTMTVREAAEWMETIEDQDAIAQVIVHRDDSGYYCQGGTATVEDFDPEQHVDHEDFRGNRFVNEDSPYYNRHSIIFGMYGA